MPQPRAEAAGRPAARRGVSVLLFSSAATVVRSLVRLILRLSRRLG